MATRSRRTISCTGGTLAEALEAQLDALADKEWRRLGAPALSAGVSVAGSTRWTADLGVADVEAGLVAQPGISFRVGSITKTFTAAAILQLNDRGALRLDEPVRTYVPELFQTDVTIRSLLTHCSGLQREIPGSGWVTGSFPDHDAFLASLRSAQQVLVPCQEHHYSNLGFAILGEVVERRSGESCRSYIKANLIDRLGLGATDWSATGGAAAGYFIHPQTREPQREAEVDLGALAPAGQLWSTVDDLLRWGVALARGDRAIASAESLDEMLRPHVLVDAPWPAAWGLGLTVYRIPAGSFAGHPGGLAGFRSAFVFSREHEIAAAAVVNAAALSEPESLVLEICAKTLEAQRETELRQAIGAASELLGSWWSQGRRYTFRFHKQHLEVEYEADSPARPPTRLEQVGDEVWRSLGEWEKGELLRVVRDDHGAIVRLNWAGFPFYREPAGDTPATHR